MNNSFTALDPNSASIWGTHLVEGFSFLVSQFSEFCYAMADLMLLCATYTADNLVCSWGRGEDGQLGHGDAEERHLPTIISGLCDAEISSITCGSDHTTAYSNLTKTLYSWGW
jgi:alpha-tubulin suppressor-like RCC1 family protein